MSTSTWTQCNYQITSYGNGLSYLVKRGNREFFLQGEDASEWRDEFDKADENEKLATFLSECMLNYGKPVETGE